MTTSHIGKFGGAPNYQAAAVFDSVRVTGELNAETPFMMRKAAAASAAFVANTATTIAFPTLIAGADYGGITYAAGVFTLPEDGLYEVSASVAWNAFAGTGARRLQVTNVTQAATKATNLPLTETGVAAFQSITCVVACDADDTLVVQGFATDDTPTVNGATETATAPLVGYVSVKKLPVKI